MSQMIRRFCTQWLLVGALVLGGQTRATCSFAADADASSTSGSSRSDSASRENVKLEPYTGPPIFLDEPESPPPAQIVNRQTATDKFPNGKLRWERQVARYSDDRFVADGFYREYHANGQLFVEGNYKIGRQDGEWQYWHENGQLNRKVMYKNGRADGIWDTYRADGTLASKSAYSEGKRDGDWITYDKTGEQPLREEHYKLGKADGEWKAWFPSGQLQRIVNFKDGLKHGPAAEWREDGGKLAEMGYADDKPDGTATVWTTDDRKYVQKYESGRLVSEHVSSEP